MAVLVSTLHSGVNEAESRALNASEINWGLNQRIRYNSVRIIQVFKWRVVIVTDMYSSDINFIQTTWKVGH